MLARRGLIDNHLSTQYKKRTNRAIIYYLGFSPTKGVS